MTAILHALSAVLLSTLLLTSPSPSPSPTPDDALEQTVDDDEAIGDEQVVVTEGHFDIGPRFIEGTSEMLVRDDSIAPPVWRDPADMVVQLVDDSIQAAPEGDEFSFIDAEPGDDLYVIPQTQLTTVAWLGWNTQDPDVVASLANGMTMRFHGSEGPGQFTMFLQNGNFAPPTLLWSSDDEEAQDVWVEPNSHVHSNWVFTEPGVYLIDVELAATLGDGSEVSDTATLQFAVGSDTDPQAAFDAAASHEEASAAPAETEDVDVEDESGGVDPVVIGLGIGGVVIVLVAIVAIIAARRRATARRNAAAAISGGDGEPGGSADASPAASNAQERGDGAGPATDGPTADGPTTDGPDAGAPGTDVPGTDEPGTGGRK